MYLKAISPKTFQNWFMVSLDSVLFGFVWVVGNSDMLLNKLTYFPSALIKALKPLSCFNIWHFNWCFVFVLIFQEGRELSHFYNIEAKYMDIWGPNSKVLFWACHNCFIIVFILNMWLLCRPVAWHNSRGQQPHRI